MIALDFNGHNNGNSLMVVDLRQCNQILEHLLVFCISNNYGTKNKKNFFIRIRIHMKMGNKKHVNLSQITP
jgi:hypothetical protein